MVFDVVGGACAAEQYRMNQFELGHTRPLLHDMYGFDFETRGRTVHVRVPTMFWEIVCEVGGRMQQR